MSSGNRHPVVLIVSLVSAACILTASCRPALAHASEQAFVLLLPTDIFIAAGTAAVLLSMLSMSLLTPRATHRLFQPVRLFAMPDAAAMRQVVWLLACSALVVVIGIGIAGPRDPLANALPLMVWTVWWVGWLVLAALIGNLLTWLTPWSPSPPSLQEIVPGDHAGFGNAASDVWPAVLIFCLFAAFSLLDPAPGDPDRLANLLIGYIMVSAIGLYLVGRRVWLRRWACFFILFRMIGSLAPVQAGTVFRAGMPGWATLERTPPHPSIAVWCLLFLGIGSFDGLKETFWWLGWLGVNPLEFPGRTALILPNAIGLVLFNVMILSIFWLCIVAGLRLAGVAAGDRPSPREAFSGFGLSILPIAVGYHAAHFMVSFLIDIQYVPIALTDPLAVGANYLGLERPTVTTGFLNSRDSVLILWLSQAGIVVYSHILAVLMAHRVASGFFRTRRQILLMQLPLAAFMIAYTVFGLWLLAAPRGA